MTKPLRPATRGLAPLTLANLPAIGAKLTEAYRRAECAWLAILEFGALLDQVETDLTATLPSNDRKRGRYIAGTGLKSFLSEHAPEVDERKARRMRDVARATAEKHKLETSAFLLAPTELSKADQKKHGKALAFLEEHSFHGAQLELGLITRGGDRRPRDEAGKVVPREPGEPEEIRCPEWCNPQERAHFAALTSERQRLAFIDWRPRLRQMYNQIEDPPRGWLADLDQSTKKELVLTLCDILAFLAPHTLKKQPRALTPTP